MSLTTKEHKRIEKIYAPALLLEKRERFVPIAPAAYVERAALWSNADPAAHDKQIWGKSGDLPGSREPEVHPGNLTVSPAEAADDAKLQFLGRSATDEKFFLDHWGWQETTERPMPDGPTPDAGFVLEHTLNPDGHPITRTLNRIAHIQKMKEVWGLLEDEKAVPDGFESIVPFKYRYAAEVHDRESLSISLQQSDVQNIAEMLNTLDDIADSLGGNPWFIWYYFMYPAHEEFVTQAELNALAQRLGLEVEQDTPLVELLKLIFNRDQDNPDISTLDGEFLWLAMRAYAGDFQSVCVIVPNASQELPEFDAQFPLPKYVGFGKRIRPVVIDNQFAADQTMRVHSDFDVRGHHPLVYVAAGTHNCYPTGGDKPRDDSVYPTVSEFDGVDADTLPPVDKDVKNKHDWAVSLVKVLAGAVHGLLLEGIGASIWEALRDRDPSSHRPPHQALPQDSDTLPEPFDPFDLHQETEATIISPEGVFHEAENVRFWRQGVPEPDLEAAIEEDVVTNSQVWWPPHTTGAPIGYQGAWGPDCADNPFGSRSGMAFPDFKKALIEGLKEKL